MWKKKNIADYNTNFDFVPLEGRKRVQTLEKIAEDEEINVPWSFRNRIRRILEERLLQS